MKRKALFLFSLVVVVLCLLFAFLMGKLKHAPQQEYPPEIVRASERFKAQLGNRVSEARELRPHLKSGITRAQVEALLGPSEPALNKGGSTYYSAARSLGITVYFDEEGKVLHVEGVDDEYSSGIERAWPLIRLGMTKTDVTTRLGGPQGQSDDGKVWQYKPRYDPTVYTITFDADDKVVSLDPTHEEFQRRFEELRQQKLKTQD